MERGGDRGKRLLCADSFRGPVVALAGPNRSVFTSNADIRTHLPGGDRTGPRCHSLYLESIRARLQISAIRREVSVKYWTSSGRMGRPRAVLSR